MCTIEESAMWDTTTEFGQRVEQRLAGEEVIWLVTIDDKNTPQPSPVWFIREGDTLLIYSKPSAPKVRNIRARPRVAMHFNTDHDGDNLMVFTGTAMIDESGAPSNHVQEYQVKYGPRIPGIGMSPESLAAEYSTLIRAKLEKVRGW
jgi:PPOX class probable F420-dependent enzyme